MPAIYRSTDANAPVIIGNQGSLIAVLDAILVNGYGSTFASGSVTNDTVIPVDGDTVTIGGITYTFRTSVAGQPVNAVLIGASAAAANTNLMAAVNGTGTVGSTYSTGTVAHPSVNAISVSATRFDVFARKGGAAGNSLTLARTSAGTPHFSVSGATLTGGGGTDTVASAGWTKPFSGISGLQAMYRQASSGMYLQVDDTGAGVGVTREARAWGWETASAYGTGTGLFPIAGQTAGGAPIRKSLAQDMALKPWVAFADGRTFYLFIQTGDVSATYAGFMFGDIYSYLSGDAYKCAIIGGGSETGSTLTAHSFGLMMIAQLSNEGGHYISRNFSGIGGSSPFMKIGDASLMANPSASASGVSGALVFPNQSDGGLDVAQMRVVDGTTPGNVSLTGGINLRGRLRGLYMVAHPNTSFADGDTFNGIGEFAGRSFVIVKLVLGSASVSALYAVETTAWDAST
jgi:hypothetical protein